jgi:Tfp pilus assembly protein PilP
MKKYYFPLGLALFFTGFSVQAAFEVPKELLNQRDPFKMPELPKVEAVKSDLENYPADQFKLIGILEGEGHPRAMIAAPNGKTYFVRESMPIGQKKGVIRKITESAIFIREKVANVLGEEENSDTVLTLPSDVKQDVKTVTTEHGW